MMLLTARSRGASVYPAVQNLLLAARACGLGGCLTTAHVIHEEEIKAILGIPEQVNTFALVPLGYPHDQFGPVRRRVAGDVTYSRSMGRAVCRARVNIEHKRRASRDNRLVRAHHHALSFVRTAARA